MSVESVRASLAGLRARSTLLTLTLTLTLAVTWPACDAHRAASAPTVADAALLAPPASGAPTTSATTPSTSDAASSATAATASASATSSDAASSATAAASSPSSPSSSAPHVRVENIGVHIGGGPNDAETKRPVIASVAPHFDDLRACWTRVDDPARGGDFGVDVLIGADGGRAHVTKPRTNLRPDAFRDCVMAVFEGIEFEKPRHGATMASYSLRFTP